MTRSIADKEFILATDLDGTFLGGTSEARAGFYAWIEANRDRVGLIFVTGRDPGFIRDLTVNQGVPRPEFVVGDVGTTIASMDHTHMISPMADLEADIAQAWGDAGAKAQFALSGLKGLTLQSSLFRYRLSYDMDPEMFESRALDIVSGLGLDAIVSDNRFFDVLPRGVSKGPSLSRLLSHLGIATDRVLVAGDTLNDLSMLEMGLPAVAVGGSEPGLIEKLADLAHVHKADGIGVSGIVEAIEYHGLLGARTEAA